MTLPYPPEDEDQQPPKPVEQVPREGQPKSEEPPPKPIEPGDPDWPYIPVR